MKPDAPTHPPRTMSPLEYFQGMIDHCYDYAEAAVAAHRPVVGILCEFTPREVILAADALPVCLCGGSADTIAVAEQTLPTNLCPLIKSTFGYHAKGTNPFLEWATLVVAETTCDGKKKMFELMAETREMHVLELPQKVDDPDALEHWYREIGKLKTVLETRLHTQITKPRLREAIRTMNRERGLRRQLAELMMADRPPLTGRQLLEFKSILSGQETDFAQYERALELYGNGEAASGSPAARNASRPPLRVLLTGVPIVHGAERVIELIEDTGAVVVCQENCTGLKPLLEDVDANHPDPLRALAEKYFHLPCSVMTHNDRRLRTLKELAEKYRPDCVIDLVWQACLTYDVEARRVERFAKEDLRLPYLKLHTDYGTGNSARLTLRVETLLETVQSNNG